jgi:sugar phosphate isomerase/epimerase
MNKTTSLKQRIGVDIGCKLSVEDGIRWAADNGVRFIDCEIDIEPNALESFDEARADSIREMCNALDVQLGLHTLSAVNIAEFSPFVRDAVDDYLRAYIDAAVRLNAKWVVVPVSLKPCQRNGSVRFGLRTTTESTNSTCTPVRVLSTLMRCSG